MPPEQKLDTLADAMFDVYEFDPLVIINIFHLQSSETLKNLSPEVLNDITDCLAKQLAVYLRYLKKEQKGAFLLNAIL